MTVTNPKDPRESARLAVEYIAAGLGEIELTINRVVASNGPGRATLDDSAGNIAQGLAELRKWLATEDPAASQ